MEIEWRDIFSEDMLDEGEQYYLQGKAKKLVEEDYGWSATVRGTRNYRVRIYENEEEIYSLECTCDDARGGRLCKHMAAVLFLIEDTYFYVPVVSPAYAKRMRKPAGSSPAESISERSAESAAAKKQSSAGNSSGKSASAGSGKPAGAGNAAADSGKSAGNSKPAGRGKPPGSGKVSSGRGKASAGRREALSLLTDLKLRDRRERSEESGAADPGAAALEEYHYFDADAIRKGLKLTTRQLQEGARLIESGDAADTEIAVADRIVNTADMWSTKSAGSDPDKGRQARFTQHSVSGSWKVDQVFDRRKMVFSRCYCWECIYSQRKSSNPPGHMLCKHETAAYLVADDYMRRHAVGDITDHKAKRFLDAFRGIAAAGPGGPDGAGAGGLKGAGGKRGAGSSEVEILTLQPKLIEDKRGNWMVRFQVGAGRLYKVKSIPELLSDIRDHETRQYGKKAVFTFGRELLDARGLAWHAFMERAVNALRAFSDTSEEIGLIRYYSQMDGWVQLADQIPLVGSILDSFYNTALAQGDKIEMTRKSYAFLMDTEDTNDKLSVKVSPEGTVTPRLTLEPVLTGKEQTFDGVRLSGEIPPMVRGADDYYCLDLKGKNAELMRVGSEEAQKIRPLIDVSSDTGQIDLYIGRSSIADFYRKALPQLREAAELKEIRPELIRKYIPAEPEFVCYLDVDQEAVLCEPAVYYGEKSHSPFDSDDWKYRRTEPEHYRDIEAETALMDFLSGYMAEKDPVEKIFVTPRDDETLFTFLDSGLSGLMTMSEVRATERFMRLKIRRRMPFHAGVSLAEGLLTVELTSDELSPEEIMAAVSGYRQSQKFIRLKNGDFLRLDENEELKKLIELMDTLQVSPKELLAGKMHIPAFRSIYIDKMMESMEDVYAERDTKFKKLIKEFKTISDADFDVPARLREVLRKYQVAGYRWMRVLDAYGFGGILADDMGLGKTLQAIAVLLADHDEIDPQEKPGTSLIVCPASLIYNWEEELHRFASPLRVLVVAGTQAERRDMIAQWKEYDVLVTSYDLLKRDIAEYEGRAFRYEVIDEAQYIKNHRTDAAKCVKLISAKTKFALTGTPIENRLSELWSIFDFIMPGFLYDYGTFREEFEVAIVKNRDEEKMERLRRMVGPFILRRSKAEVLKDLPEKLEEVHYAGFGRSSEQRKLYDAQVVRMREDLRRKSEEDLKRSRIEILAELTKIRQICCDPALLYENYKGDSVKKEMCMELVRSVVEGEHKALIFSQFTRMLELLKAELDKEKIPYYEITGATPKEARIERVRAFNADRTPVFLISLKAGGTGLNLTGADVVIHYDPWWNVAVQNQATDRAHRIGQTKVVTVYQLILKGSIEERIMELQQQKRALAEDILSSENVTASTFSREELLELLE